MIAGPADGAALEPRARLDRRRGPSQRESTSSPSTAPSIVSRTRRLASSMSSRRPVSFHQPRTMCGSTRSPLSTRCWIASVISSSPRGLGRIARAASWIAGVNMYTPTSARSVFGSGGFSASATTRPSLELRDAVVLRVGHRREQDQRVGRARAERRRRARRSRPAAGCRRGTSRTASRRGTARPSAPRAPGRPARPGRCRSAARRTASRRPPRRGSRRRSPAR